MVSRPLPSRPHTHIVVNLLLGTHALAANAQIGQGYGGREEGRECAVAGMTKIGHLVDGGGLLNQYIASCRRWERREGERGKNN